MNKIDFARGWAGKHETTIHSIKDVGNLTYTLRQHLFFSEANELDAWKNRMDWYVANEFTEPISLEDALEEETSYPPIAEPRHWVFTDENGFEYREEEA